MKKTENLRFAWIIIVMGSLLSAVPITVSAFQLSDPQVVQQSLDQLRNETGSLGAAVTYGDAQTRISLSSGTRKLGTSQPIESDYKMRIGSVSKTFTAALVLQLVDEGRVDLDNPVEVYLPGIVRFEPANPDVDGRAITVRHLLQHAGGIASATDLSSAQAAVDSALAQGSQFDPGQSASYSNVNFILAAWLVESVTGQPFATVFHNKIAMPLGLQHAYQPKPGVTGIAPERVHGYMNSRGPFWNWFFDINTTVRNVDAGIGAGAVIASLPDVTTFVHNLLAGYLFSPALLEDMQDTYIDNGTDIGYGLGLTRLNLSCGVGWGHNGLVPGYITYAIGLEDGRQAAVNINMTGTPFGGERDIAILHAEKAFLDTVLCN